MRALAWVLVLAAAAACSPNLVGAPCSDSSNCPGGQGCIRTSTTATYGTCENIFSGGGDGGGGSAVCQPTCPAGTACVLVGGAPQCACPLVASADFYVDLAAAALDSGLIPTGVKQPVGCEFGTLTGGIAAATSYAQSHPDASVNVWAVSSSSGAVQDYTNETFPLVLPSGVSLQTTATVADPTRAIIHYNNIASGVMQMHENTTLRGMTIQSDLPIAGIGDGIDIECGAGSGSAPTTLDTVTILGQGDAGVVFSNGILIGTGCSAVLYSTEVQHAQQGLVFYGGADAGVTINNGTFAWNGTGIEQQGGTLNVGSGSISNGSIGYEAFGALTVTFNNVTFHDLSSYGFWMMASGTPAPPVNIFLYNDTFTNSPSPVNIGTGTVVASNDNISLGDAGTSGVSTGMFLGGYGTANSPVNANLYGITITGFAGSGSTGLLVAGGNTTVNIANSSFNSNDVGISIMGAAVDAGPQLDAMYNTTAGVNLQSGTFNCDFCGLNNNTNSITHAGAGLLIDGGAATLTRLTVTNSNDIGVLASGGTTTLTGPPDGGAPYVESNNYQGIYATGSSTSVNATNVMFQYNGATSDEVTLGQSSSGSFSSCTFMGPTGSGKAHVSAAGASFVSLNSCSISQGDVGVILGDGTTNLTAQLSGNTITDANGPGIIYTSTATSHASLSGNLVKYNEVAFVADAGLPASGGMVLKGVPAGDAGTFSFAANQFWANQGIAQVNVAQGVGWNLSGPPGTPNEFYCYRTGGVGMAAAPGASATANGDGWQNAPPDGGNDYRGNVTVSTNTAAVIGCPP